MILSNLPKVKNKNLLVGYDSSDDAAVYQIDENTKLIATLDFFSPMVDDPYLFGKIAAANALSDVYAMGGTPIFALNIVCYPESEDLSGLTEMLKGGSDKLVEANTTLAGGHSIYDPEIKYGLSVTGMAGKNILSNNTAQTGDLLILTKPLGVGIIMAANRVDMASKTAFEKACQSMERLNKYAADISKDFSVSACTDITGFGLLVHLAEMANTHSIRLFIDHIPYFSEAYDYADDFLITSAGQRNRNFFAHNIDLSFVDGPMQEILFDPQTSGGLLFAIPENEALAFLEAMQKVEPTASIIGQVIEKEAHKIIF